MPPWLVDALAHLGASAPLVLFLAWLYTKERAERMDMSKALLDLTRDLVTVSQQMTASIQLNTSVTKGAGDQVSRVAEKLDFILQKRR